MRDVEYHLIMVPPNRTRTATRTPRIGLAKVISIVIIIINITISSSSSHVTDAVMCARTMTDVVWNDMKDRRDRPIRGTAPLSTAPSVITKAQRKIKRQK